MAEITFTCQEGKIFPGSYKKLRIDAELDEDDQKSLHESLDEDKLLAYICNSYLPSDVFEEEDLKRWAEENGYVKPE